MQIKEGPTCRDLRRSFLPVGRQGFPFYPLLGGVAIVATLGFLISLSENFC